MWKNCMVFSQSCGDEVMEINMNVPNWYCCPGRMAKQILLRKWQQVMTTGRTKRGNGYRVGETHHRAKLTDHDVELIRLLHEDGMSCTEIATKFECSRSTISDIANYKQRITVNMGRNNVFE